MTPTVQLPFPPSLASIASLTQCVCSSHRERQRKIEIGRLSDASHLPLLIISFSLFLPSRLFLESPPISQRVLHIENHGVRVKVFHTEIGDGADGAPPLDITNGEEFIRVQPSVSIVLCNHPLDSPGTLYIYQTCSSRWFLKIQFLFFGAKLACNTVIPVLNQTNSIEDEIHEDLEAIDYKGESPDK